MLTCGEYQVDETSLHPEVIHNALQTWFRHKIKNEVDSAVLGKLKNAPEGTNIEVLKADLTKTLRDEMLRKIVSNELGTRAYGPRKDPVEVKYEELVVKKVKTWLKNNGYKYPKDDVTEIDFGNGKSRTRVQLIDQVKARQGEQLHKDAERLVAAELRATKAAPKGVEPVDPDNIGA